VDRCSTRAAKKYPNVNFKLGYIRTLDIQDGTYDVIIMHFVLHHIPHDIQLASMRALERALKRNGTLFVREPTKESHGTGVHDIQQLLDASGVHEKEGATLTPSLVWVHIYSGAYVKPE